MRNISKSWCLWIVAGCVSGPIAAAAQPTTAPADEDTQAQIRELRQEVRDLRDQLNATRAVSASAATQPANGEAAAEIDNNLLQHPELGIPNEGLVGMNAGWDPNKGFVIRSEDGAFLLHPWAFVQFRNATTYTSDTSPSGRYQTQNGFELPRAKFIIDGNIYSKDLTYQFIWATSDTTGNLGLQDAWGRYHIPDTQLAVEAGQIRNPVDHEQILFATRSLTPGRSIVNNVLLNGDDIVKGVEVSYGYDDPHATLRGEGAFTSGERNFDTTFQQYPTNTADWGAAGRVEWKYEGRWQDYTQFTALGDTEPLLVLGAGADYTEAGGAAGFTHVADVQYDTTAGTAIYAAYLGRYTRGDAGLPTTNGQVTSTSKGRFDTYDSTVRLMVAQLINGRFEPFARYEYIQFDSRELPAGSDATVNDLTLGFNYYFYGHRAKLSADASYLPNGSPVSATIDDLLATKGGQEIIVQVQFQLML
jgi:hypothetical protein